MLNKCLHLISKDRKLQINSLLVIAVLILLGFLKNDLDAQERRIKILLQQNLAIEKIRRSPDSLPAGLVLNGIIFNNEAQTAIINNNIFRVGDLVTANIKVVAINSRSVVLNNGARDFELKVSE